MARVNAGHFYFLELPVYCVSSLAYTRQLKDASEDESGGGEV